MKFQFTEEEYRIIEQIARKEIRQVLRFILQKMDEQEKIDFERSMKNDRT